MFIKDHLTTTNSHTPESAAPGEGRGGGIGSGGEPLRYAFTSRGWVALSPWNDATYTYSILQLYLGYNPISKLEVVSLLNIPSQAHEMYAYNTVNRTAKYNPKVYLGTSQTIAIQWNYDYQKGITLPEIWPEVKPQKGEAVILKRFNIAPLDSCR